MFINDRKNFKTVDCERDAALKRLPSHPDRRHPLELIWKGRRFEFTGKPHDFTDPISGKPTLNWTVTELTPAFASREERETVLGLIVDALQTFKGSYGLGIAEVVEVTLPAEQKW